MGKSEIHTSEDFLTTERNDLLLLKGFGEKSIDKLTKIIMEAVANLELENEKAKNEDLAENQTEIKEAID